MKATERRETLAAIENGQVDMIVGTHALIQEGVRYHALGLVIMTSSIALVWNNAGFYGKRETILMSHDDGDAYSQNPCHYSIW
ncbi:hypothetical protein HGP05_02395 [Streptococcus sanguinis]|uniref:Uncharacterized protein n=1 Tax=Streptococcus sanguinis TaxID=1305 RepID=A0A7Y0VBA7_STRSA|nr:hypothetical protein [Streptococcus sanguinis]